MRVEVVYGDAGRQSLYRLDLPPGASVEQAIRRSGVLEDYPEIDLACNPVGVFSEMVALSRPLHDGERVEIYRPLQVDPKEARRRRAERRARR